MEIKLNDIKQWLRKYRFLEIEVGILLIAYLFRILPNAGAEGVAIWAAFVFPLYYFVYFVMQKCGTIKLIKQMNERQLIFQFLVIILAGLMVVSLLSKNRTFYFWDFGGYWGASIDEAKLILHDPQACLRDLYNSINKEVYNRIIPFIISIPLNILGVDFHIYELVVFGMFVVPTYLAFLSMFDEQFALHNVGIICFTFFLAL